MAAKATWIGRIGTRAPGKAGSVSNETQPSMLDVSTMAPKRRGSSTDQPLAGGAWPGRGSRRLDHHGTVAARLQPRGGERPSPPESSRDQAPETAHATAHDAAQAAPHRGLCPVSPT